MADTPMPEVDPNRKPKMEFIGEWLYCDGTKVAPWQLTIDEIEKYIPKSHQSRYLNAIAGKPIPNKAN